MSTTIFGDPFPVRIRCDQCHEIRTDCVPLDESTNAVTGRRFLCVPCINENSLKMLKIIMMAGEEPLEDESRHIDA